MSGNSFGKKFKITCFGESHGRCIGVVIDGCPPGLPLSLKEVQRELDKRRPGQDKISTPRKEEDEVKFLSGVFKEHTTGAPLCMLIWNKKVDSEVYEEYRIKPRPGHADYPALVKYKKFNDYRGGGRFSGRITAACVMAGAIAKKLLRTLNLEILAHTVEIGGVKSEKNPTLEEIRKITYTNAVRCADEKIAVLMKQEIMKAKNEGDSVGGIIECVVLNVPVGIGEPVFDNLDADIAKMLFSIPAVKGVEFGAGFNSSRIRGSENNDPYIIKDGKVATASNNAGGVLGGLSNGMPIIFRIAFKPTPSISKKQHTIDIEKMTETTIEVKGKHDPCVVPRAVPIVEAAAAIVLVDHALRFSLINTGEKIE